MEESSTSNSCQKPLGEEGLIAAFEQSWEYIRHTQDMFWQSFTAIFTIIVAILFFTLNQEQIFLVGIIVSAILAIVGFLVCIRTIRILKEHFITVNRIRRQLDIDKESDLIIKRWKRYKLEEFSIGSPEIIYIFIASQMYAFLVSILLGYFTYKTLQNYFTYFPILVLISVIGSAFILCLLEIYGCKQGYKTFKD